MSASVLDLIMCVATWVIPVGLLGLVSWLDGRKGERAESRMPAEPEHGSFVALPILRAGRTAFSVPPLTTLRDVSTR